MAEGFSSYESHFHIKLHISTFYQIIAKWHFTPSGVSQAEIHDDHPDALLCKKHTGTLSAI